MTPWLRLAMALCIVFTPAANAAQGKKRAPAAKQQSDKSSRGMQEGIGLKGIWEITVRNPDGTVARSVKFQNALLPTGKTALAFLLQGTGTSAVQTIWVHFDRTDPSDSATYDPVSQRNKAGTTPCLQDSGCVVQSAGASTEWGGGGGFNFVFPTLVSSTSVPNMTDPGGALILSGTFTPDAPGTSHIHRVHAMLAWGGQLAGQGTAQNFAELTRAVLPAPLPVTQGQLVQFTYTLSFS